MSDERATRRIGLGMMLLFWVLFLAGGAWWFQGVLDVQRNPNAHLAEVAVGEDGPVVLTRNRAGHFVATGRINGEPVEFLLDTGATYVAVPEALADRLGLERTGSTWFNTANGRVRGDLATLETVRLGGYVAHDVRGSVSPGLGGEAALLGMSFLERFDIEIRGEQMVLRPAGR